MPAQLGLTNVTATGRQSISVDKTSASGDNVGIVELSGGTWTLTATIQANPFTSGQDPNNNGWQDVASIRMDTLALESTPTLTTNTARTWKFDCSPFAQIALNITVITGTLPLNLQTTFNPAGVGQISNVTVNNQAITGTQTITSSSASALTVGRLGATTPAFQVDASTSTCITGVKVTAGATTTGVAVAAVGETNVPLKIDGAGSGLIALGDTSTGPLYAGRGSLKQTQQALTLTALGTTQNSTPTAAQLLGGINTQTGATGAGTVTLPSGTTLSAACARTPVTGDSFVFWFASLTGQALTITGATGTTVIGTAAIPSAKNGVMLFINTGTNTWNIYVIVSA